MIINCKLDSLDNIKLLSYFIPEKFYIEQLQKADLTNCVGALYTLLKTNIHTYDLQLNKNILRVDRYNKNNFMIEELNPYTINQLDIYSFNNIAISTENNVNYENCSIDKIKYSDKLHAISCKSNGVNDYLIIDVINDKLYFVEHSNKIMYEKLLQKL